MSQRPTTDKPVLLLQRDVAAVLYHWPNHPDDKFIVFGLTDKNIREMQDGAYVHVLGEEMGLAKGLHIIVLAGADKPAVMKLLEATTPRAKPAIQ